LQLYLEDDTQAWVMDSEGLYSRAEGGATLSAQARLLGLYDERVPLTDA
jgi:hypothetical protein